MLAVQPPPCKDRIDSWVTEPCGFQSGLYKEPMGENAGPVRVTEVKPMEGYRIWLLYDDGVEGVIDLSDMVEHESFAPWRDKEFFATISTASTFELIRELSSCSFPSQ